MESNENMIDLAVIKNRTQQAVQQSSEPIP
jgi:hypothetical protein